MRNPPGAGLLTLFFLVSSVACRRVPPNVHEAQFEVTDVFPECPKHPTEVLYTRPFAIVTWFGFWELPDGGLDICLGVPPGRFGDFRVPRDRH